MDKTSLEKHMKRFNVDIYELYDFINIIKNIDMPIGRIIYCIKNCDTGEISNKEYRFMYYCILDIDVCNHSFDSVSLHNLKGNSYKRQIEKYYNIIRNHIPVSRGESSKIRHKSEFKNYY